MVSPRPSIRRDPMPMADLSLPSSPSPACMPCCFGREHNIVHDILSSSSRKIQKRSSRLCQWLTCACHPRPHQPEQKQNETKRRHLKLAADSNLPSSPSPACMPCCFGRKLLTVQNTWSSDRQRRGRRGRQSRHDYLLEPAVLSFPQRGKEEEEETDEKEGEKKRREEEEKEQEEEGEEEEET